MPASASHFDNQALLTHNPKIVRDALLRHACVLGEIPLPDLRVLPQALEQASLELAQPDAVLGRRGPEVRREEPLVESIPLRDDEAARLEGPQVV